MALFVAVAFLVGQMTGRSSDTFQLVSIGFLLSLPVGALAQLLLRTTSTSLRGPVR